MSPQPQRLAALLTLVLSYTNSSRFSKESAKIKMMGLICRFLSLFLAVFLSSNCGAEATEDDLSPMVERINQRYDDFYRRQHQTAAEDQKRELEAAEIKKQRMDHEANLEKQRQEYVKARKKIVEDPRLEKAWLEQQQALAEQNKMAGRRFVQKRNAIDAIERRGRRVPEKKEYDLED